MTDKSHLSALREIRRWNTNDVICALRNNGLSECTDAFKKRKITGEQFLELSEVALGLWRHDITTANIRKLATFIQDVKKSPSKFVFSASFSDDAWDTDFDDDLEEENLHQMTRHSVPNSSFPGKSCLLNGSNGVSPQQKGANEEKSSLIKKSSRLNSQSQTVTKRHSLYSGRKITIPKIFASESSSPKVNGSTDNAPKIASMKMDTCPEKRKENPKPPSEKPPIPSRPPNISPKSFSKQNVNSTLPKPPEFDNQGLVLREICEKLTFEADIVDEYMSMDDDLLLTESANDNRSTSKSIQGVSTISMHQDSVNGLVSNSNRSKSSLPSVTLSDTLTVNRNNPSTLTTEYTRINGCSSPSMTHPKVLKRQAEVTSEPAIDSAVESAVSNLSAKDEENREMLSDSFVDNSVKPSNSEINDLSKSSRILNNGHDSCINEENRQFFNLPVEEVYEIIHEDEKNTPPPLPTLPPKPYNPVTKGKSTSNTNKPEVNSSSGSLWPFGNQKDRVQSKEKVSQEAKRNNTTSSSKPNHSYVNELPRSSFTRPLPPPPPPLEDGAQRQIKIPLVQMPWYFNTERKKAEEMLKNCEDGTFIIRPSTQTQNPLTLTLKYGVRSFNICIRHRPDGRYALGTAKPTEQTFSSVEELVKHYSYNELLLYSNGLQAGTVVLKSSPRKD